MYLDPSLLFLSTFKCLGPMPGMHVCVCVCVCVCMHMYAYMYVCIHMYLDNFSIGQHKGSLCPFWQPD